MKLFLSIFGFSLLWSKTFSASCRTPLGIISECVSLYDCPQLVGLLKQSPISADAVHFLRQSGCGFEGNTPKVCCGPLPSATPQSTVRPRPNNNPDLSGNTESSVVEDSEPSPRGECGLDNNEDRIFGGEATDIDEFPWMALLGYRTKMNSITYQCGGVLINHRYILTAAHCTVGEIEKVVGKLVSARLGEYDTRTEIDCLGQDCADAAVEVPVQAAYPHSGFSDKNVNRKDDIALVRLAKRVRYTSFIKPICLAERRLRLTTGSSVYVAGWGKTLEGKNSPRKLKLSLPIFDKSECVAKYSTLKAELTEGQICAGGEFAKDACRGDSGGPLMKKASSDDWECVAVVSFGFGCGSDGWPGVYTSVAAYNDWIRQTMRSSNL
ncbi:phenoloxidase-activating enzyme 1-like [Leptidea sinapis]|uniref:phenoloxidase-activating enzyme 1-like n=1 Tax=Leptidea sinapis TaxID=189913 RepID=UPI0021448D54|nr:phenoloxidase-activating enzyme 1-like [Leptidea sinapis]